MNRSIEKKVLLSILSHSKKISTKTDINTLLKKYLKSKYSPTLFSSLVKRKMIKNIFLNYYYILDPEEQFSEYTKTSSLQIVAEVLNLAKVNWYIGLDSAIKFHGLTWQGLSVTTIINSKISGTKNILGSKYIFKKTTKPIRKINLLKKGSGVKSIYFSDREKTLIDCVYFGKKPPAELVKGMSHNRLLKYLATYSKNFKKKVLYYG